MVIGVQSLSLCYFVLGLPSYEVVNSYYRIKVFKILLRLCLKWLYFSIICSSAVFLLVAVLRNWSNAANSETRIGSCHGETRIGSYHGCVTVKDWRM